jgi:hypothetical protein
VQEPFNVNLAALAVAADDWLVRRGTEFGLSGHLLITTGEQELMAAVRSRLAAVVAGWPGRRLSPFCSAPERIRTSDLRFRSSAFAGILS